MRLPLARRSTLERLQEDRWQLEERSRRLGQRNRRLRDQNVRLRRRVDLLRNRIARLQRQVRGPEDLRFVFIVTYARSGSTLLMGVLNSLPGYLIRGENHEAAYHLFRFQDSLASARSQVRHQGIRRGSQHPFFGAGGIPLGRSLERCRLLLIDTVLRPGEDTRVTGFKEIRWNQPDLVDYIAWLQEAFPSARFIVNTRNPHAVAGSGMWAKGDFDSEIRERHARVLSLAESLGEVAYHVHYDDYVSDPTKLRGLVEWLGEEWDEERVREVMATEHSVHNKRHPGSGPS